MLTLRCSRCLGLRGSGSQLAVMLFLFSGPACQGQGQFEAVFLSVDHLQAMGVFGGTPASMDGLDYDRDGVANLFDNCVNTANPGQRDAEADGLGDPCDPSGVNEYGTAPVPPGAEGAVDSLQKEMGSLIDETETEPTDGQGPAVTGEVAVRIARLCRNEWNIGNAPVLSDASNLHIEVSSTPVVNGASQGWFPEGNGADDTVSDAGNVAGSAAMANLSKSYPTTRIPLAASGAIADIIGREGETDFVRRYVRICDDANQSGGCDVGETQYVHQHEAWLDGTSMLRDGHGSVANMPLVALYMRSLQFGDEWGIDDPRGEEGSGSVFGGSPSDDCDVINPSPLILDLKGDGILLSGLSVRFDLNANGSRDLTTWLAASDDALLALDVNRDGVINDGGELFGNNTMVGDTKAANGFAALAQYDLNGDGIIDSGDPVYGSLVLWLDDNRDGRSQKDELHGLAAQGVDAINLDFVPMSEFDAYGNESRQRSSFIRDGEPRIIIDAWMRMLRGVD